MAYGDNSLYNKYLNTSSSDGCCGSSTSEDCGCCPPGLVSVVDGNGEHIACLTPADAQEYNTNNVTCGAGFVKLYEAGTKFLGCVPSEDFAALYAIVNPS